MPKKKTSGTTVTYLEWVDSTSFGSSSVWSNKQMLLEAGEPEICRSIGFILRETKESLMLVGHMSAQQTSGDICIPKVAILKRKDMSI